MKIIFIDVDGVLINREACKRGFGKHSPECVAALNHLLIESGAMMVVSSCWRVGRTVPELRDLFNSWGILPGRVLDRTPYNWEKNRGQEIQMWLDKRELQRGDVESFVIIDDDADMAHLLDKLVRTKFDDGLTEREVSAALNCL